MCYSVTASLYDEILARLTDAIGSSDYFSGTIACESGPISCLLRTSVIVYRRTERLPAGTFGVISDLVPVWWEFHTRTDAGEELLNDFSFGELRSRL